MLQLATLTLSLYRETRKVSANLGSAITRFGREKFFLGKTQLDARYGFPAAAEDAIRILEAFRV